MEIVPIVAMLGSFTAAVLIVYFVAHARQRKAEIQASVQAKLIDRFGSSAEIVEFLKSPAGREFVTGAASAPAVLTRERILTGISRAIITTTIGAGLLALTFFYEDDFAVPAAILFCIGFGYLIATLVSYRLSAKFHLNDPAAPPDTNF